MKLQEYDFQLIHKPGNTQKKVDALSQRPDYIQGKDNNKNQTLLKKELFRSFIMQEGEFWRKIEEAEEFTEEEVREAVEHHEEGWRREGKMIFWKERVYVPDFTSLREEIITKHHDSELAGHLGYTKTHELITRNYWWPRMLDDIKQYVAGCERCQANKPN